MGLKVRTCIKPMFDEFPEDLSGHWAQLGRLDEVDRWRFTIWDYPNNPMLTGIATSEQQAARIVWAWDAVIVSDFEGNEDPTPDPAPDGEHLSPDVRDVRLPGSGQKPK